MSLRQLRAHQKRVLMQELGVEDDFLKVDTANLAVDSQGFFLPSNLQGLKNLISDLPHPLLFVEIGSWLGSSTRFLAQQTGGCVIAIDPWTGSAEHQKGEFRGMLPLLQQQFLRNCYAYRERILPIQRTSEDALALPIKDIDLLYIDGAHDYASVLADLRNWTPRLAPYGIVCGDDWNWGNEKPVRRAVVDFAKKAEKLVQSEGNFWWLA